MSITYVVTTLFRGDDIEQTEYLIGQLSRLSDQPRRILVFNGGLQPRGQTWLEEKYPMVKVLELDKPNDWGIKSEFHYCQFVWTQLYKHVETEYYLKMDRDVCVSSRGFDTILIDFMSKRPEVAAAGTLGWCTRNFHLDSRRLFDWLPRPVSFSGTQVLNGGVQIVRTSSMQEIGPTLEQHGRQLWLESLDVGEDDLISLTLHGTGHKIENCPRLLSLGSIEPSTVCREHYDAHALEDALAHYGDYCAVHGFKPFAPYRAFYKALHQYLGGTEIIENRSQPSRKDLFCMGRRRDELAKRVGEALGNGQADDSWSYVEPLLTRPFKQDGLSGVEKYFVQVSDIYAHLPTLYLTTKNNHLRNVLDLGTGEGNALTVFLFAVRDIGGHVTTVDIDECHGARIRVEREGLGEQCTFLQADDLAIPWEAPIDHLFMDTTHIYEQVLNELRKYEPHVVAGGVITLHDTTSQPQVWNALTTYFKDRHDVRTQRWFHNNGLVLVEKLDGTDIPEATESH